VAIGCVAIVWIVNRGLRYIDKKILKKRAPLSRTRESDLNE